MTLTLTVIDDQYQGNAGDGVKTIRFTGSFTNPYTAGGESVTLSTYFPHKFLGGNPAACINPSVAIALAGVGATAAFRGDPNTTLVAKVQLFNAGLSGTSSAGLFVDNTTADISTLTTTIMAQGY
jgi:hypothetical protein